MLKFPAHEPIACEVAVTAEERSDEKKIKNKTYSKLTNDHVTTYVDQFWRPSKENKKY